MLIIIFYCHSWVLSELWFSSKVVAQAMSFGGYFSFNIFIDGNLVNFFFQFLEYGSLSWGAK